jgi:hypothetical protein
MIGLALTLALHAAQAEDTPLSIDAIVDGKGTDLTLRVQLTGPAQRPFKLQPLAFDDVTVGETTQRDESIGASLVRTMQVKLTAQPGRHVLDKVCAEFEGGAGGPVCAQPIYLDVGTKPDRSAMKDIVDPEAVSRVSNALVAVVVGTFLGVLALLYLGRALWRRRPAPRMVQVAAEPAHIVAWRSWEAIRDDRSLSDFDRASALSEIFRTYAEAALSFPARAYSTSETLDHLESLTALPRTNLPRAKRLLRATDRVKYAEVPPDERFFAELEDDLRGFIDATKPVSMSEAKAP